MSKPTDLLLSACSSPVTLHLGDCLEVMKTFFEDNTVDSIICDPPYALSFMGAAFDTFHEDGVSDNVAFQKAMTPIFADALRVAKPGAYLLAFGGTRTYHRLACAIEDAGWECRETIAWVYGSGFPKSLNVSKAIAKRAGGDLTARAAIEFMCKRREELGMSRIEFEKCIFGRSDGNVRNWEDGISLPKPGLWPSIKKAMQLESTPFDAVMERGDREVGRETGSFGYQKDGERWEEERILREATTEMAKEWDGWGTCLKPAFEPIVVARKPLEGTVAANVLKYGTGAINIDACRVPTEDNLNGGAYSKQGGRDNLVGDSRDIKGAGMFAPGKTVGMDFTQPSGRFPANLIHDGSPEVLACFPSSGKAGSPVVNSTRTGEPSSDTRYTDKGSTNFAMKPGLRRPAADSPARFFYCAKASRSERGEGNDHLTVKPIALMRWLVKLVTRKGGVVLDPFMGSGTTGIAALAEGCRFVGIEKDPHYFDIAKARVTGKPILPPDDDADSNPPSTSETVPDGLPSDNPSPPSTTFVQDSLPL